MSCGDMKDAQTDPEPQPSQLHSFPAALVINPRLNGYVYALSEGVKGVRYGLTVPDSKKNKKKQALTKPTALSAFGDEDSDDEHEAVPQQLARQAASKRFDSKVADMHAAALSEDPSVFDYDGIYETMQETKAAPVAAARAQRSSKYIEDLLDKAQQRQREQDIVYERRQVKERQVEDHLFGDKEKFVTAAYKKKLQEQQLWEAQQKVKDDADEKNAAENKGDMSGFYGNLLTNNVAFGAASRAAKASEAETTVALPLTATAAKAEPPQAAVRSSSSSAEGSKPPAAIQPSAGGGDIRHVHGDAAARPAEPSAAGGVEAPSPAAEVPVPVFQAAAGLSAAKHTDADAAAAARERYLARKRKASGNTSAA